MNALSNLQKDLCPDGNNTARTEYIWTLPKVGASGPTGGDDSAGGYMPRAIVTGTTPAINWVHSHHNAKPILLTNSTGTVVAYTGHAVLGFPGQFANAVGLAGAQYYYNRYRDYNDVTGRYIQADPIGLAGDANPYAYAMGNTLRYTDPTGEFVPFIVAGACAGGGCQGAAIATGALLGGAIAWIATHPIIPYSDAAPIGVPITATNCPDRNDECQAAIARASGIYNRLVGRRIAQYESGGSRGPDAGHYDAAIQLQTALRKAVKKVKRVCAGRLPPQLPEWERVANMPIQVRH